MNARSSNRILVWALAISLAIHIGFAIVARTMPAAQAEPEKPQHIDIVRIATPPPTPPATPRPQPRHLVSLPSHASTHARISVHPPRVVAHGGGSVSAGPPAAATPGPSQLGVDIAASETPSPVPHPACSVPFAAARTLEAITPEAPEDAAGIQATAQVQVTLDDGGRVTDAHIYTSTGTMSLDRAAVEAARRSRYAPSIVDCMPTGGTYLFKVDFQS
jgi:protein TonB